MMAPRRSKRAWRRVTRSPKGASTSAAAARASASWSIPRSRRSGRASSRSRACPAPPSVASTSDPGRDRPEQLDDAVGHHGHGGGKRWSLLVGCDPRGSAPSGFAHREPPGRRLPPGFLPWLTRRKRAELGLSILPTGRLRMSERTGLCHGLVASSSLLLRVWLRVVLGGACVRLSRLSARPAVGPSRLPLGAAAGIDGVEALGVPDLDPVVDADHRDAAAELEAGELAELAVDQDPTLGVDRHLEGLGRLRAHDSCGRPRLRRSLSLRS